MAEAAVLDQETTLPQTPPEEKRPPGRKPGFKPFNNELTPEEFFQSVGEISDSDWPKNLVYVWRRDPMIDNTNGGREPKYIDVVNHALTIDNVKEEHGSGTYKLILNANDKYLSHTIITIDDPEYPPHIAPGDWLNHPKNKRWVTWKPLIEKWWKDKIAKLAGPTPGADGGMNMAEVLRFLDSQQKRNGDASGPKEQLMSSVIAILPALLQQQNSAQDPSKLIDAIAKMKEITAVKSETDGLLPLMMKWMFEKDSKPAADPMLPFILKQLENVQAQNTELIKQMMNMKSEQTKPQDPVNMVDTMLSLVTKVQGIVQPAAPLEPWQQIVSEGLPGLIDLGKSYFTSKAMFENARRQPQPQQQPRPTMQPQPPAVQANPLPQAQTVDVHPEPAVENGMDQMEKQNLVLIANLAAQALNLGLSGTQFADQMVFKFGEAAYMHFTQNFPKDGLIAKFKAIPEVWGLIGQFEAQLPQFIEDFYAPPEEEPEPEPEPVVVAAPKKGGKKK